MPTTLGGRLKTYTKGVNENVIKALFIFGAAFKKLTTNKFSFVKIP